MASTTTVITADNIASFFKVADGSYCFKRSGSQLAANNLGVNSSTATTTLTALEDMTVSMDWAVVSESNYDKLTVVVAGSTKVSAVSGTKSGSVAATSLAAGKTIALTYYKDSSNSASGEKAVVSNLAVTVEEPVLMTAAEFNALKKRAKAEMKRRCYNGSLASYGTSTASDASKGASMQAAQGHDLMDGILAAVDVSGVTAADIAAGKAVPSGFTNARVGGALSALESVSATSSASGCKSSCTGLCQGNCSTGCSGCDGCSGCGGYCSYSCSGDCEGDCDGGCSSCSGSCSGTCDSDCGGSSCMGDCTAVGNNN